MSSMRSASSSTNTSTPLKRSALLWMRSRRRPGVATSTSRPLSSERTWAPIDTPPMASAEWMREMPAIGAEAVEDLAGEFAGRAQHQHAAGLGLRANTVGREVVEDRQREGRGLAGAGLGDADDIALGEQQRNGLGLDRGGGDVFFFGEGAKDRLCEAEIVKRVQFTVFLCAAGPPRMNASGLRTRGSRHPAWTGLSNERNVGKRG